MGLCLCFGFSLHKRHLHFCTLFPSPEFLQQTLPTTLTMWHEKEDTFHCFLSVQFMEKTKKQETMKKHPQETMENHIHCFSAFCSQMSVFLVSSGGSCKAFEEGISLLCFISMRRNKFCKKADSTKVN